MKFLVYFLMCGNLVHIESLNPRSVNVALETVLEFDGKHSYRDVKAINKLQSYLTQIKSILGHGDDSRRHNKDGFKFRDYLKHALQIISTYDDNDLLDIVAIANNEIRKYHYKGCKFYELVENQNLRRAMADKLITLNELTATELRHEINEALNAIDNNDMSEKKKHMLDYLDSVYVGADINEKMKQFTTELNQFRHRSKRANLNLVKVVKDGVRSIIFDHYSNLNDNARKELKHRLETIWKDISKMKEDFLKLRQITEKPLLVKSTINQDVWQTVTMKSTVPDLEVNYLKSLFVKKKLKARKRNRKRRLRNMLQPSVTEKKKRKKKLTTTTPSTTISTTTTTPATTEKESYSSEIAIDSAEIAKSIEITKAPTTTKRKSLKKMHRGEHLRKNRKIKKKPTPVKETSVEEIEVVLGTSKFSNAADSQEVYKKRFSKKRNLKHRKNKKLQRIGRINEHRFKIESKRNTHRPQTPSSSLKVSTDYDETSEVINTSPMRKHYIEDRSPIILYSSDQRKQLYNNAPNGNNLNKVVNFTTPNVVHSINRIEKVLDEIKDIVKNVTIVNKNDTSVSTTSRETVNVTNKLKVADEEITELPGRKSLIDDEVHDLDDIDKTHQKTTRINKSQRITEAGTSSKRAIQLNSFFGDPANIITENKNSSISSSTNPSTKSATTDNDDMIIPTRNKTNSIDDTIKFLNISSTVTKKPKKQEEFKSTTKVITPTNLKLNDTRRVDTGKDETDKQSKNAEFTVKTNEKIDKILKESQISSIDNVIERFDDENKEINEKINKKTDKILNSTKSLDLKIDDPFNLKDDIYHEDDVFK